MNEKIITFFKKNKLMLLATSVNNIPYNTPLYYCFLELENKLLFLSDAKTKHAQHCIHNKNVSCCVVDNNQNLLKSKAIQLSGFAMVVNDADYNDYYKMYVKKYPAALAFSNTTLFEIEIVSLKYTDNTLGFAKKILWELGANSEITC